MPGLYVTPGLVDIHTHVYAGTGEAASYAGDNSVYPDGFTLRAGVTTVVDAGGSGWRNFEDFKQRIIDRSKTRVLAFLNIVGHGMRGGKFEQDLSDMEAAADGGHGAPVSGPDRRHQDRALRRAGVDAGRARGRGRDARGRAGDGRLRREPTRAAAAELVTNKLRPGDIYTHVYSGLRGEQDASGHVNPALLEGRKRGVIFDVGHGGGSFLWRIAVPAIKEGFLPDSISTDLHVGSMNAGMKDMLNVMSKFLALGMPLDDVIARTTWNPAREIRQEALGHLSRRRGRRRRGLRLERGRFGLVDRTGRGWTRAERLVVRADAAATARSCTT